MLYRYFVHKNVQVGDFAEDNGRGNSFSSYFSPRQLGTFTHFYRGTVTSLKVFYFKSFT